MKLLWIIFIYLISKSKSQDLPSCKSPIYCQGELLDLVQRARLFKDSKTFVDMRMVHDEKETLRLFDQLLNQTDRNPSKAQIKRFVETNFKDGDELENWKLDDFDPNPKFLNAVRNSSVRDFARDIVAIWPTLARKIKPTVLRNESRYSILPLPNGFVVPGGRFKETYYWDSYWIIKGLLISGMNHTVESMLNNFFFMIEHYGYIPNGARVYYLNRSHPPFLTFMVDIYYRFTKNFDFVRRNIQYLEEEMFFFLRNKTVIVRKDHEEYVLARYDSESGFPRPESYAEDLKTCSTYATEKDKKSCYADLKTAAESGMDFSYRWVVDGNGGNNANLSYIKTRNIIPVELNAILCKCFKILSKYYSKLGRTNESAYWNKMHSIWFYNIQAVLYDKEQGVWFDYDIELQKPRKLFYQTNIAPLWAELFPPNQSYQMGLDAANYFESNGVLNYYGGTPNSLNNTGEQWDFPAAWPPMQSILVEGLKCSGHPAAQKLAKILATRWIQSNMLGFEKYKSMFEKYNALHPGQNGGGGEYDVQTGFGWTNGVVLEFIVDFFSNI